MLADSTLNLSFPVIGPALKVSLFSHSNISDPETFIFKITNSLPSSSTTNPKAFSERYITDEPIETKSVYMKPDGLAAYLSLCCAAYGSVWRSATITTPLPTLLLPSSPTSSHSKEKVHFSYESSPAFFLQSGSIVTSTSPGFSSPKSMPAGGQKLVKLTREEVNWVHDMLIRVWLGMVAPPSRP